MIHCLIFGGADGILQLSLNRTNDPIFESRSRVDTVFRADGLVLHAHNEYHGESQNLGTPSMDTFCGLALPQPPCICSSC